jgi:threonine dehydrogenase-like Zn-dependent dehydrogenase
VYNKQGVKHEKPPPLTHRFPLEKAGEAYALMAGGKCGKVAVCFDEELK